MLYRFLPIVPLLVSVSAMAGQGLIAEPYLSYTPRTHQETLKLDEIPIRSISILQEHWQALGFDKPPFNKPPLPPKNETDNRFRLKITTPAVTVIDVAQNTTGTYEFQFSSSVQSPEPEKVAEDYDYFEQLELLAQKNISFQFDPAQETLFFQYAGIQLIIEDLIEAGNSLSDRSLLISAATLTESTIHAVVSLVLFLDEHRNHLMPVMTFSGGVLEKVASATYSFEINPQLFSSPIVIDLTQSDLTQNDHDQQCLSLSQNFWLVVSSPQHGAIIGDPSPNIQPMDGSKKRGRKGGGRKTKYNPAPGLNGFQIQGSATRRFDTSASSVGGGGKRPPDEERETDYKKIAPSGKNEFELYEMPDDESDEERIDKQTAEEALRIRQAMCDRKRTLGFGIKNAKKAKKSTKPPAKSVFSEQRPPAVSVEPGATKPKAGKTNRYKRPEATKPKAGKNNRYKRPLKRKHYKWMRINKI